MDKKTAEQIQAEIAGLKDIKPRVRRYSTFGDDNHKQIDLQIRVLEENLGVDDIIEWSTDDYSSAQEAIFWRDGTDSKYVDVPASLVEDWKSLTGSR